MKCVLCNNEMDSIKASFQSKWGEYEVTIDEVKAYRCKQCQRFVFEPEVARMIQNITAGFSERQPDERPELINVDDVADLLSVSNQTVYNMIKDGRLKAVKVGREWRFSRHQIEKILNQEQKDLSFYIAARNSEGLSAKDQDIVKEELEGLISREQEKGSKE